MVAQASEIFSSMDKFVFRVYDKKLKVYSNVFCSTGVSAKQIFTEMANDVSSPQYGYASDFDCIMLFSFDESNGLVSNSDSYGSAVLQKRIVLCGLDTFIDEKRIELQYMIKTLNYLPNGYFKMPPEMQQSIKDDIDIQVKKYSEYLSSQMDLDLESTILSKLESSSLSDDEKNIFKELFNRL